MPLLAVFAFSEDFAAVVVFAVDVRFGFSVPLRASCLAERDGKTEIGLNDLETAARAVEITF